MLRSLRLPLAAAAAVSMFAFTLATVPSYAGQGGQGGHASLAAHTSTAAPLVSARRSTTGTITGTIKAPHRIKQVDVVVYKRVTATDGSKAWLPSDDIFAIGYGLSYSAKTHVYSFQEKAGSYRLQFNGTFTNGKSWGVVGYGPGKPAGAPFGKTVVVKRGKVTRGIGITAAGDFANIPLPPTSDYSKMTPYAPVPGGRETAVTGTWPRGTVFYYTWQIGSGRTFLSFHRSVTVPANANRKTLTLCVYADVYGRNGAGISVSAGITTDPS
jgi:hypothetical protein